MGSESPGQELRQVQGIQGQGKELKLWWLWYLGAKYFGVKIGHILFDTLLESNEVLLMESNETHSFEDYFFFNDTLEYVLLYLSHFYIRVYSFWSITITYLSMKEIIWTHPWNPDYPTVTVCALRTGISRSSWAHVAWAWGKGKSSGKGSQGKGWLCTMAWAEENILLLPGYNQVRVSWYYSVCHES